MCHSFEWHIQHFDCQRTICHQHLQLESVKLNFTDRLSLKPRPINNLNTHINLPRNHNSILIYYWASVADIEPALKRRRASAFCLLGYSCPVTFVSNTAVVRDARDPLPWHWHESACGTRYTHGRSPFEAGWMRRRVLLSYLLWLIFMW